MSAKTCTADELERETAAGWKLREVHHEDRQEPGQHYYTNEIPPGCTYSVSVTKQGTPVVVRRLIFVLERDEASALAKLAADLEGARDEARRSRQNEEAASKEKASAEKAHAETKEAFAMLRKQADRDQVRAAENERLRRKLEEDIWKIRREVGEARVREILTPPESRREAP